MTPKPERKPPAAWPEQPVAGICMHFSSLPSPYGIGDIARAALAFVDQMTVMNLRVWQVLPAGPTGYGDSPYHPLSAFAGNELLIGIEPLLEQGLLRDGDVSRLEVLPADRIDYGTLIPWKLAALERAAERFLGGAGDGERDAYATFREQHDALWLNDYSLFRVLKRRHSERPWREWAPELAHREAAALDDIRSRHSRAIERIKVIQFFFHRQWEALHVHCAARGIRLFGDLPIYVALDSADAWSRPGLLQLDAEGRPARVAGVPPDYFSNDGQLWGNPLYDWRQHARTGYRWWIDRVGHWSRYCALLRVDHFRGFESYWAVPAGEKTARRGQWVKGPGDAIFDALRQSLGDLPVVAEDLGVITDEVIELRRRHGLPGMKVLHFELASAEFRPDEIPEDCMCFTATHDNDTTVGWFSGKARDGRTPGEIRDTRRNALRLTGGKVKTIHRDLVRLACDTPARVAIAPMQDYLGLGSAARLNRPGKGRGNWRWRMRPGELSPELQKETAALIEAAGRV